MCATVFRANDGQTQSPSTFIPAYLSEQSQFIEIVRQHMDFLPPKSCNRMVNAIEKPLNVLFGELYPHLLDFENRSYICLTGNLYEELKSQDKIERALRHGVPPEGLQERFPYFTNPMVLCDEQDGAYCGPPPSQRVVNRGQIVFTFEYDPATNQQEFLDHQIRWSIAGTDGKSLLDRLYQRLCRFRDFRQLEVVWSGNKSFHIHCLLDSRHLNRSRFAGEITVPAGSWPEIPDCPMFRAGLMACWAPIEEIVRNTLGIEIDPDTRLKEPERYRRTPWGIRIAVAGNILGFPPGTRVPQIVTYSKGRAYARTGANGCSIRQNSF